MASEYGCDSCGRRAVPSEVDTETLLGAWYVTCGACGTVHVEPTAYGQAEVAREREGA